MLIIFDVDGTLVGGESHDWACFDEAIASVVGIKPTREFYESLTEITAQAIVQSAIRKANLQLDAGLEERVCAEYLRRLREIHVNDPGAFPARHGVADLLEHLNSLPGVSVAIATGDWLPTISVKLAAAGIDVSKYPMATSSDASRRSEIIRLAAQRANRSLSDAVYVGDGVWDVRASREAGIPFIGTGTKLAHLRQAGAEHLIEVMEAALFVKTAQMAIGITLERPD